MIEYYGHYASSVATLTGCRQELVTTAQTKELIANQHGDPDGPVFPSQISYLCPLCGETHNFHYTAAYQVSSPSQRKKFLAWTQQLNMHGDVAIL